MKRFYAPYTDWEDFKAGMWRKLSSNEEPEFLQAAIEFTGNAELYGKYMLQVLTDWPISTKHNFTNTGMNRRAWVGHAACQIAINCPEYIVRQAWSYLTEEQQIKANAVADIAIQQWELLNNYKRPKHVKDIIAMQRTRSS